KVVLNYKIGSGSYKGGNMQINGDIKYSYLFADLADNSSIEFYFTYKKSGIEIREPALGSYKINELNIVGNEVGGLPTTIRLYQNYPNPFNSSTTIRYELIDFGQVQLNLINILGQKISTIVDQVQSPGLHQYKLNTEDYSLSSGVYLYSLSVGNSVVTKKMLLIK
ncbi:MAG: T9SS type A sorting domain-containing protein, partial [Ignavibacteria bacterium]|nr:T9SS type A sorting domain-containing protein [Ignavibacteria bacterium]